MNNDPPEGLSIYATGALMLVPLHCHGKRVDSLSTSFVKQTTAVIKRRTQSPPVLTYMNATPADFLQAWVKAKLIAPNDQGNFGVLRGDLLKTTG